MELEQQQQDPNEDDWLDPKAQAKYLGISLSEVYWHLRQYPPSWTFYRVTPTRRLSKRADLDAFLEKVKVSAVVVNES